MPIRRFLRDSKLAPEEIKRLNRAYGYALRSLYLVDRNDPITEIVGKKIIEISATVHDPKEICSLAIMPFKARILKPGWPGHLVSALRIGADFGAPAVSLSVLEGRPTAQACNLAQQHKR